MGMTYSRNSIVIGIAEIGAHPDMRCLTKVKLLKPQHPYPAQRGGGLGKKGQGLGWPRSSPLRGAKEGSR